MTSKDIEEILEQELTHFTDQGITWTAQGTAQGLVETVAGYAAECVNSLPEEAVIYFKKLPDGGYQIGYYKFNK